MTFWWFLRYPWHATYHFRLFFPTIMLEISEFHFRTTMVQGGNFSNFGQFLWNLRKETGDYWYDYGMWPIILVYFFPTKTMEMMKIHFKHYVRKYGPWYWICPWLLCRDRSAAARRCACFFVFVFFITITPLSFVGPLTAQMILQQVTHIHTKSPSVFIQNYASL